MMSGDDVLMMRPAHRIEVFTGTARRRRWSAEQKAQVVEDSYATTVGEAAARHGVSKSQLFNWRREARDASASLTFAQIEVTGADEPTRAPTTGLIELQLGGASVRIWPEADRQMAAAIVMALRAGGR
jgi:transposase